MKQAGPVQVTYAAELHEGLEHAVAQLSLGGSNRLLIAASASGTPSDGA